MYKSDPDGGWTESTVIPQRRPLYGFAGQRILLGHLRSDGTEPPPVINLAPAIGGSPAARAGTALLNGKLSSAGTLVGSSGELDTRPDLTEPPDAPVSPLAGESARAAQPGGVTLGAGLSARAPRLSILLTIMRKPIAKLSLARFLLTIAGRSSIVGRVVPHPTKPRVLFAASLYGLFQSVDGGVSWFRAFPGLTPAEKAVYDIVFDPKNPKRAYMGTSRGLYISNNGGEVWQKSASVPELRVSKIVVDPDDPRYVYTATQSGVYRSDDGGRNFILAYYNSLRLRRDVQWMVLDPFNSSRAYLGTRDGIMVSDEIRTGSSRSWRVLNGLRSGNLVVSTIAACSRHPGHLYAMTRADIPTVIYGAHGPESYLLESWDGGKSWRVLASNRTQGDIRWFSLDPRDPDTVWVAFSQAVVRIERRAGPSPAEPATGPVLPNEPSMGEVMVAALRRQKLDLDSYQKRINRLRSRNWLPARLTMTFSAGRFHVGGNTDDLQFAEDRYLLSQAGTEYRLMAWGTWRLPDFVHRSDAIPMLRSRVLGMNDAVRNALMQTIHRNYGELQRLRAKKRASLDDDLKTRVLRQVRIEMLEAVVDLASGGYLSDYRKQRGK